MLLKANDLVKYVPGILATDSKGAFDAINKNSLSPSGLPTSGTTFRVNGQADMDQWRLELGRCHDKEASFIPRRPTPIHQGSDLEAQVRPWLRSE